MIIFKVFLFTILLLPYIGSAKLSVSIIELPPYGIKETNSGIHVDFIKKVLDEAQLEYNINIEPYSRALKQVSVGRSQISLFFKRPLTKGLVEVGKSIGFENLIVSHVENPIENIHQLHGKKVGVIRQAKYENSFDQNKLIKKINLSNYYQGLGMLGAKRLDAIVISKPAYLFLLKKIGEKNSFKSDLILNTKHNYIYMHEKTNKDIIEKVRNANRRIMSRLKNEDYTQKYLN